MKVFANICNVNVLHASNVEVLRNFVEVRVLVCFLVNLSFDVLIMLFVVGLDKLVK